MNIIYTVCNRTNLNHALVLVESALRHQPNDTFYLCWVDTLPLKDLPSHIKLLTVAESNIPHFKGMEAQYYHFELLPASRPWFGLEILRRNPECERITFLAPTVLLTKSIEEVAGTNSDVVLTPNINKPLASSTILDDKRILNIGMFHSGSWILKPGPLTIQTLQWWADRTVDRAKFDLCNGMNTDQLWLNYVPVWVPDTVQVSNPGWHYGLHAVLNRNLVSTKEGFSVDTQPLISVDFAGLDHFDPVWSDHAALLSKNAALRELYSDYKKSVKKTPVLVQNDGIPGYGKPADIKKNRISRNKLAGKLKALTVYIDQF
ncbi:MAG: hypothetical protein ABIN80_18575 [Dyadobacter sp.]|uniref:hypothetical protein n=1 Tax=Dyadobacter sp. TaxID=1914288 RepID=UPI003263BE82